jgi:hypothetical protein
MKIVPFLVILVMLFGAAVTLATRVPAMASGSYNNADIATDALTHVGQKYGQCWPFVRDMIYQASNHTQDITAAAGGNNYFLHLQNAGGTRITDINALSKGDIVQQGQYGGHTFIIVSKVSVNGSTATYNVVDSNHAYNDVVMNYNRTFSLGSDERAYRFGTVNGSSGWNGVGNATFFGSDHLTVGQTMNSNQYITSGNVEFALIMQTDGNLCEYNNTKALWCSGTSGNPGAYLGVQGDGNIVIYSSSGHALWATGTNGDSLSSFYMQTDGNIVAYTTSGQAVWASNTGGWPMYTYYGSDRLYNGQTLTSGNYIRSADSRYALLMQTDGNLIMYGPGYHVLWGSGTGGNPGAYLGLQSDGNMVVYSSSGHALWASNTGGQSLSYLVMQTDGNLVAYNTSNAAIWATGTNGQI